MAEKSLGQRDRGGVITLLIQECDQAFSGLEKQQVQAIAFWQNPLIVTTGQQVSTIQVCCLFECLPQRGSILSLFRLLYLSKRPGPVAIASCVCQRRGSNRRLGVPAAIDAAVCADWCVPAPRLNRATRGRPGESGPGEQSGAVRGRQGGIVNGGH